MSMPTPQPAIAGAVTIVTQTRVRPESAAAFAQWQKDTSGIVAAIPGFIDQTVMPPSPPGQVDWVILQRFTSSEAAVTWLHSEARLKRIDAVEAMLLGRDDVHIVNDGAAGVLPSAVSAVISTRVKPGQNTAYRSWERRIAAAQARAPGFQGYRFEPPLPGVQEESLSIVRFDSEENLQKWLASKERKALLDEATAFTEDFHMRIARTGFDQWFPAPGAGVAAVPTWKQNMLVVLMIYPVVFLFGYFVQTPFLTGRAGLPFSIALFIANVFSVFALNYLVPWASIRFAWWLQPSGVHAKRNEMIGVAMIVLMYGALLTVFTRLF
jgi:antibiotic biosynthesis monooxygenase (ABM) superfamily enzyme